MDMEGRLYPSGRGLKYTINSQNRFLETESGFFITKERDKKWKKTKIISEEQPMERRRI